MENLIEMDDLGYPYFRKSPLYKYKYIYYIYIYYNVVIPKRKKNMIYHTISNLMFDLFRIYYIRATAKPRQY